MAGPMVTLTSGKSSLTAWAMTWAVECLRISRPLGECTLMKPKRPESVRGEYRSTALPLSSAATTSQLVVGRDHSCRMSPGVIPGG